MAKLTKSITINAPVEKVFKYVEEPTNLPKFWPSMVEVSDVKRSGDQVRTFNWVYKMAGLKVDGNTEITERIPNQKTVSVSTGGTIVSNYAPEGQGTKVTVDADYKIPGALLGKLAEPLVIRINERESETLLENLKTIMEA